MLKTDKIDKLLSMIKAEKENEKYQTVNFTHNNYSLKDDDNPELIISKIGVKEAGSKQRSYSLAENIKRAGVPITSTTNAFRGESLEPKERVGKKIYSFKTLSKNMREVNSTDTSDNQIITSNYKEKSGRITPSPSPNKYNFISKQIGGPDLARPSSYQTTHHPPNSKFFRSDYESIENDKSKRRDSFKVNFHKFK